MRPTVCETAERLYEALGPAFTKLDEAQGWPLLLFCDALCSVLLEPLHVLISDRDDQPGWAVIFDPDECPAEILPWLAMAVGARLTPAMSEGEQREAIKSPEGLIRGTPAALIAAVKATLTGSKTVLLDERYMGSAYKLRVRTLDGETPDPAATQAAAESQKPVGNVLVYAAVDTGDWDDVADPDTGFTDWDDVAASNADWDDVAMTPPA